MKLKSYLKDNKSGFSLIELLVVVALMIIIATVSGSALVNVNKTNAKSCATKLSSMLSQSKINSLSGIDNILTLSFDGEYYVCSLTKDGESEAYKTENIGIDKLEISIDDYSIKTGILTVRFDKQTGALTEFKYGENGFNAASGTKNNNYVINVTSDKTYKIDISSLTGNQEPELVSDAS